MHLSDKTIIRIETKDENYSLHTVTRVELGEVSKISSLSVIIGYTFKDKCVEETYFQITGTESTLLIKATDVTHIYYLN